MEPPLGHDFNRVRVHSDGRAEHGGSNVLNDPAVPDQSLTSSKDSDTFCDLEKGHPVSTIRNEKCGRPCTEKHEALHVADISPCCESNRDFLECRGFGLGVTCSDELKRKKDCHVPSPPDRGCCHDLDNYRFSEVDGRDKYCKKKITTLNKCPF
jgi:hypothetical protein